MDAPKISVVITAFRSGELIKEAIESVLAQTFGNFEIIIVDNNASEETKTAYAKLVNSNPDKIRVVHENVQGACSARNRGIREAKGVFIAFLDDDDTMYPERLFKQFTAIEDNPQAIMVYGGMNIVSFDGKEIIEKNKYWDAQNWALFLFGDSLRFQSDPLSLPPPSVFFFRKEVIEKVGLFDERFNPIGVEDTEFLLRMWEAGQFIKINEPLINYRLASQDFANQKRSGNTNFLKVQKNLNLFYSILIEKYFDPTDKKNINKFKKIQSQWLRELSLELFEFKDGKSLGRKTILRAIKCEPLSIKNWKWYARSFMPGYLYKKVFNVKDNADYLLKNIEGIENVDSFFITPNNPKFESLF